MFTCDKQKHNVLCVSKNVTAL